jgi:hypothetical protein
LYVLISAVSDGDIHSLLPRMTRIEARPIFKRLQFRQILRSLRVDKLASM